jgi:hypothetical protein
MIHSAPLKWDHNYAIELGYTKECHLTSFQRILFKEILKIPHLPFENGVFTLFIS